MEPVDDVVERVFVIDTFLCDLKEAQIRDGLHIFGQSPTGRLERDLAIALARVPRGEGPCEASLIRALADDLKLGIDPLTADLGTPWTGPPLFANASVRSPSPLRGGVGGGGPSARSQSLPQTYPHSPKLMYSPPRSPHGRGRDERTVGDIGSQGSRSLAG